MTGRNFERMRFSSLMTIFSYLRSLPPGPRMQSWQIKVYRDNAGKPKNVIIVVTVAGWGGSSNMCPLEVVADKNGSALVVTIASLVSMVASGSPKRW